MIPRGAAILGFPRSGTTLLRRLLGAHPEVAAPPESGLLSAAVRFLKEQSIVGGASFGVTSGLAMAGFEAEEVTERTRAFARSFLDEYADARGASIWVEKNPYDVFHLEAFEGLWGTLSCIAIVRNGLDVVASNLELIEKTDRWFDDLHPYIRSNPRPSLALAQAWRETTEGLLDLIERKGERACLIRYEDLVLDPAAELARIGTTLGIEFAQDHTARALEAKTEHGFGDWKTYARSEVHNESVHRYTSLSQTHLHELVEILGPTLDRLGYDRPRSRPPGPPAEAIRRHQMGLMVQALRQSQSDSDGEP